MKQAIINYIKSYEDKWKRNEDNSLFDMDKDVEARMISELKLLVNKEDHNRESIVEPILDHKVSESLVDNKKQKELYLKLGGNEFGVVPDTNTKGMEFRYPKKKFKKVDNIFEQDEFKIKPKEGTNTLFEIYEHDIMIGTILLSQDFVKRNIKEF